MSIASIDRTATICWCPILATGTGNGSNKPSVNGTDGGNDLSSPLYLALGSVAGALDSSFSTNSSLEVYSLVQENLSLVGSINSPARFNRLAWTHHTEAGASSLGWILGALETGEIVGWAANNVVKGKEEPSFSHAAHTTAVKGLDVNSVQQNLYATGAGEGELYIWDLKNPGSPFTPGNSHKNQKLLESNVSDLRWNKQVPYILGSASSNGTVMVWDLRNRREVMSLNAASAQTQAGFHQNAPWQTGGMPGARRSSTVLAWNPEISTQLITATDDDVNPALMVWDLRNAHAPERVIPAHSKGMLDVSWCGKDSELLVSCGKDNRTVLWNPSSGQYVGELPVSQNWVFGVEWCPKDPDLVATSSFDGKVSIVSLQGESTVPDQQQPQVDAHGQPIYDQQQQQTRRILEKPPRWLRRPCGTNFGFAGTLVSFQQMKQEAIAQVDPNTGQPLSAGVTQQPPPQSSLHLRSFADIPEIKQRSEAFEAAVAAGSQALMPWCDLRVDSAPLSKAKEKVHKFMWRVIQLLFDEVHGRPELLKSMEPFKFRRITNEVSLNTSASLQHGQSQQLSRQQSQDVSHPPGDGLDPNNVNSHANPFAGTDNDSNPFGGPFVNGQKTQSGEDVANQFGSLDLNGLPNPSEDEGPTTDFRLFPAELYTDGEAPQLSGDLKSQITEAVLRGDYGEAVELCQSDNLWADAIMLANLGGEELNESARDAYLISRLKHGEQDEATELKSSVTLGAAFYRLMSDIIYGNLEDVVDRTDVNEWVHGATAVISYSKGEEMRYLCGRIGRKLMQTWQQRTGQTQQGSENPPASSKTEESGLVSTDQLLHFAAAMLLVASDLEKVVYLWYLDMVDTQGHAVAEEHERPPAAIQNGNQKNRWAIAYKAHAKVLQDFIERVNTVRAVVEFDESDDEARSRLSLLYTHYVEFADVLAQQGLVTAAWRLLEQVPAYTPPVMPEGHVPPAQPAWVAGAQLLRDRLYPKAQSQDATRTLQKPPAPFDILAVSRYQPQYNTSQHQQQQQQQQGYGGYYQQQQQQSNYQTQPPNPAYSQPQVPANPPAYQGSVASANQALPPKPSPYTGYASTPATRTPPQQQMGNGVPVPPISQNSYQHNQTPPTYGTYGGGQFSQAQSGYGQPSQQPTGGIPGIPAPQAPQRSGSLTFQPSMPQISGSQLTGQQGPTANVPPAAPPLRDAGGWNDAPMVINKPVGERRLSRQTTAPAISGYQQQQQQSMQQPVQPQGMSAPSLPGPPPVNQYGLQSGMGQQQNPSMVSPSVQSSQFGPPPPQARRFRKTHAW